MDWNTCNVSGDSKVRLCVFGEYKVYSSMLHLTCDIANFYEELFENTTIMNADVVFPV